MSMNNLTLISYGEICINDFCNLTLDNSSQPVEPSWVHCKLNYLGWAYVSLVQLTFLYKQLF